MYEVPQRRLARQGWLQRQVCGKHLHRQHRAEEAHSVLPVRFSDLQRRHDPRRRHSDHRGDVASRRRDHHQADQLQEGSQQLPEVRLERNRSGCRNRRNRRQVDLHLRPPDPRDRQGRDHRLQVPVRRQGHRALRLACQGPRHRPGRPAARLRTARPRCGREDLRPWRTLHQLHQERPDRRHLERGRRHRHRAGLQEHPVLPVQQEVRPVRRQSGQGQLRSRLRKGLPRAVLRAGRGNELLRGRR